MNQSFERIEPHLYKRQYQAANGEWSTLYYGILVDWKGKRRRFPLGSKLKTAREELTVYEARNVRKEDFDKDKERIKVQGMALEAWLERYLDLVKSKKSWNRDKQHCKHLKRLVGSLSLSNITQPRIMEYKNARLSECIVRHGRPVGGKTVRVSTVNREIRCLLYALGLAVEEKLIENVPKVKLDSERHLARERVLSREEYTNLLGHSPRWLQRVIVAANESALSRSDALNLTWDAIGKDGLIRVKGGRAKTGVIQRVAVSPAFEEVLGELQTEFKQLPNVEGKVLTRDGRPITKEGLRKAFEKALRDGKISDFRFHDLRHTAITQWASLGLPVEVAMVASGHKLPGMHGRYTNLRDQQILEAFEKMFTRCLHGKTDNSEKSVNA